MLVEKFDDGRVRVKRPADAKQTDHALGFDPYRTQIGMSGKIVGFFAVVLVSGIVAAFVSTVALLKKCATRRETGLSSIFEQVGVEEHARLGDV